MADYFHAALAAVLVHEGGFVNDSADPGGATNFGVSLRSIATFDGNGDGQLDFDTDDNNRVDETDIRNMTLEQASAYYRSAWWDKYGYARIGAADVAVKLFDLAVNMGGTQAHKIVQRAVRATGAAIVDDGQLGPKTIAALNACDPGLLTVAMKCEAAGFYRSLAAAKPNLAKFLTGWLNRAYSA